MKSSSAIAASSQSGVSRRNAAGTSPRTLPQRTRRTRRFNPDNQQGFSSVSSVVDVHASTQTLIQALLAPTGAQDGRQQERRLLHAVDARQVGNAMTAVTGHFDPAEADVIVGPVVCGDKQRGGNRRARTQPDDDRLREVRVTTPSVISNRHRQLPGPTEIVPEPHGEKLS